MMLRQALLPALSRARMVMVLAPLSRGMLAQVQGSMPSARPLAPEDDDQTTSATPVLSVARPRTVIVTREVATAAPAGEVMDSAGGVVSFLGEGVGGCGATGVEGVAGGVEGVGTLGGASGLASLAAYISLSAPMSSWVSSPDCR